MNLQQELKLKLANSSYRDVAQLMGYTKAGRGKAAQRITNVLHDPLMNLYAGAFDFKFGDELFLRKLCSVLNVDIEQYQNDLTAIHAEHDDRATRFKSYVFIDTGFLRTSQPIHILCFCQSQRYIQIEYEIRVKPLHEQVRYVKSLVKQHYKENEGKIGIWGSILEYVYIYAEGCKLSLSPSGDILEDDPVVNISRASVKVGGADITKLIVDKNDS